MTFFKIWTIENVSSLALSIQLYPSFDYSEVINSQRNAQTTETGQVNQYKLQGGSFEFKLPLDFVNSSDAAFIREQWQDQNIIRFTQSASDNLQFVDCRITNRNDPLNNYSPAQFNEFDGVLNLVTVKDYNTTRGLDKLMLSGSYFILGTSDGILAVNAIA